MKIDSTAFPVLGTNAYDCWSSFITEEIALRDIEIFAEKLKPAGYEYYCFDAGWYFYRLHYTDNPDPAGKGYQEGEMDEFGRWNAAPSKFPHGLKAISDACHAKGMKFGVHLSRGIPWQAVDRNTRIKGTDLHAADICDRNNICPWGIQNYGVDMTKPGAQEYYDSVLEYLDENGVDFVKVDDIAEQPAEILGIVKAIEKVRRPIFLSLSPGDNVFRRNIDFYRENANMVRISKDIWDRLSDLDATFERWELWEDAGSSEKCWLDLDMVPFGELQSYIPEGFPKDHVPHDLNEKRQSRLSLEAKRTVMTQRAMAASPILYGGNLAHTSEEEFALLTNEQALACNRNGITGKRIYGERFIDIRKTPSRMGDEHGWLGIFNRKGKDYSFSIPLQALQLPKGVRAADLKDIWTGRKLDIRGDKVFWDMKIAECCFLAY